MKIITMKRLTEGGEPLVDDGFTQCDPNDWFGVIETKEEEIVYDKAFGEPFNPESAKQSLAKGLYIGLWNELVKHAGVPQGLAWGDDDVYGYFRPDETVPEVGEEWVDGDNDRWVRTE